MIRYPHRRRGLLRSGSPTRQSGATAIEFAFIFPLLFLITYGAIVYGYLFVAYQTVAYAAQAGAEAAVQVAFNSNSADYQSQVTSAVATEVSTLTSFLVGGAGTPQLDFSQPPLVKVTVTYNIGTIGLFPTLIIPPFFTTPVPPLPASLTAYGVVTLAAI